MDFIKKHHEHLFEIGDLIEVKLWEDWTPKEFPITYYFKIDVEGIRRCDLELYLINNFDYCKVLIHGRDIDYIVESSQYKSFKESSLFNQMLYDRAVR